MSNETLSEATEIIRICERKYQNLKLISITDQPRAFNNFVAFLQIGSLKLQLINDRDQILLTIDDGSKYGLDPISILEHLDIDEPTSAYSDYNTQLFRKVWKKQIPEVLETLMSSLQRINDAIDSKEFKNDFHRFLLARSRKIFGQ